MGDVLDQSEVDALLAAVEGGVVEVPHEPARSPSRAAPRGPRAPAGYDFKRPMPVTKDQLRALEVLHEGFARNLGAVLSARVRQVLEVRLKSVEQLTYSEFTTALSSPTSFHTVRCDKLPSNLMIEIHPSIAFPLIELLLGATQVSDQNPERGLSELEIPIVCDVVERALDQLVRVWAPVDVLAFRIEGHESNPQLVQSTAPNEPVVLLTFELALGDLTGKMNLCYPYPAIEPLMPKLAAHAEHGTEHRQDAALARGHLQSSLRLTHVDVRALLVETTILFSDLTQLAVGDVIETDRPADGPVVLLIGNLPKFLARPGASRGKRAAEVIGLVPPELPT